MFCPECRFPQPEEHRYCIVCGARLPRELLAIAPTKTTQMFLGFPTTEGDAADAVVRVSRYLRDEISHRPDGPARITPRHVRLSVWEVDRPVCAVSLPEDEAIRLASFLLEPLNVQEEESPTHGELGSAGP
jgi:hypothetical protein